MEFFTRWLKNIGIIFALLFCVDLIFGYSGTMLMIKDIAIRHFLFVPTAICLYLYCFSYIYVNKIKLFSLKDKTSVFGSFKFMDWAVLAFIISTTVSFLMIPQLYGDSIYLAKSEILDVLCMLLMYFPIRFIITWKELSFHILEKALLICLTLLAVLHIVLYVGQSLNSGFIEGYFNLLTLISGDTAIVPGIVLGHGGYPRVMYSTSIYLLVGIYLLIKKLPQWKVVDYFAIAIFVVAVLTTMTKSLWYGIFIGIVIFTICYIIKSVIKKQWKNIIQWLLVLCGCALLIVVLNATLFEGIVGARINNSFVISQSNNKHVDNKVKNKYAELDNKGAVISNDIKVKQTELLLEKWLEKPVFGWGYGSYIKSYIRSDVAIFSYEMLLPAMLMKIGIVGVGLLLLLIFSAIWVMITATKQNRNHLFAWLYLLLAFGMCIQTNPLLLSFTGISVVLLLLGIASYHGDCKIVNTQTSK